MPTATDLTYLMTKMIINRHPLPEWATFSELRNGTGSAFSGAIDVATFNCYPSKNGMRVAYEIKASRHDFSKEIDNPKKRAWVEKYFNQTYFVTSKGVCDKKEIPEGWGLIRLSKNNKQLKRIVIAKHRDVKEPTYWLMLSALRRAAEEVHNSNHTLYRVGGNEFTEDQFKNLLDENVKFLSNQLNKSIEKAENMATKYRKLLEPLETLMRVADEYYAMNMEKLTPDDVYRLINKASQKRFLGTLDSLKRSHNALGELLKAIEKNDVIA